MGEHGVIALLRGINVGGRNKLPMADLRAIAAGCGYADPVTHLQSGNLVLPSVAEAADVAATLTAAIRETSGLDVPVITRTFAAWKEVVAANPYPEATDDGTRVHVVFLAGPATAELSRFDHSEFTPERLAVSETELYLSLPDGIGRSKLAAAVTRIDNADRGTIRNWNTVAALGGMITGLP